MPIYKNNKFQERIEIGDREIKRVYLGKTLKYGLYELAYHDRDYDYEPVIELGEVNRYAWGKKYNLPPAEGNDYFKDYFDTYRTHFGLWCDDTKCKNNKWFIDYEDHKNFDLCAKWYQKKFTYGGNWHYKTYEPGGVTRDTAPTPDDGAIYFDNKSMYCMPNCTFYVHWRVIEAGAKTHPTGENFPAANLWIDRPGPDWEALRADDGHTINEAKPGDVICFSGGTVGGHVAFVEWDGRVSNSAWTAGYCGDVDDSGVPSGARANADPNNTVYRAVLDHWDEKYTQSGSLTYGERFFCMTANPAATETWTGGHFQGILRYTGEWSGGEEITHYEHLNERDCSDQDKPTAPLPRVPEGGYDGGWDSGNPQCNTYHRICSYDNNYYVVWSDDWDKYASKFDDTWPEENKETT